VNRVFRWVALLVGAAMVVWGGLLVSLEYLGASAIPYEVSVRRQGGDRGDVQLNRYNWSIHYAFRTPAGESFAGNATAIGNDTAVKGPGRIRYLPAFPYVNAPADQTGLGLMPLVLITLGLVVVWALLRRRSPGEHESRKRNKAPRSGKARPAQARGIAVADPVEWLARYRRNARLYAWGFFAVVAVVIAVAIRLSLDEWGTDWLYSTAFAVLVTAALAFHSRRSAESAWVGTVEDRTVIERRPTDGDGGMKEPGYRVVFRTREGRKRKVRVGGGLFAHYREGAEYRKVAGLNYPLPMSSDAEPGYCGMCGADYLAGADQCPQCRAPVLRLGDLP
jgi:hypothetical protein